MIWYAMPIDLEAEDDRMPRYALKVEYHGKKYSGWQRQARLRTVQGSLEAALSCLNQQELPSITAAGRTDSGVHAWGQVVHCDLPEAWDLLRLRDAVNWHLGRQRVRVLDVAAVGGDFSARHSAVERVYVYRILVRRPSPAIKDGLVWHVPYALDAEAMREGAVHLVGRHDFTTFRAASCQAASPLRTLNSLEIDCTPCRTGLEIEVTAKARSFLHRQVRSIVGSLERVGAGAIHPSGIAEMLAERDRNACGPVAPAAGLYLAEVKYQPDPFQGLLQPT